MASQLTTMRIAMCSAYGSPEVVSIREIPRPYPKDNEILIKIHATAVNSGDTRIRRADPWIVRLIFGWSKPSFALGGVLSGVIEAVGKNVTKFAVGDQVFGSGVPTFQCHAEYKCLPESGVVAKKPAGLSFEEAASIPFGWLTALHFVKQAKVGPNMSILIVGASGAVGSAAVQLCKQLGAQVTAVCSTTNVDLVLSIGADFVLDYSKNEQKTTEKKFDILFETVGKTAFSESIGFLKDGGTLVIVSGGLNDLVMGIWPPRNIRVCQGVCAETKENLEHIRHLFEDGKGKVLIDKTYLFEDIVEAHRHVDGGHKKGNVVVKVI